VPPERTSGGRKETVMQRTFTVLPLLLLLFILFGCNDPTNPKTKSVRDVYDKMAKEYGPAEEINTYSSDGYENWSCWYWTRGFEYDITKRSGEDAYVSSWYTFTPIRKTEEAEIPVGDG
jgi:hypothetical protein